MMNDALTLCPACLCFLAEGSCNCKDKYTGIKNPAIKGNCLEPFHFDKYSLDLKGGPTKPVIKDVCVTLTPTQYNGNDIRYGHVKRSLCPPTLNGVNCFLTLLCYN